MLDLLAGNKATEGERPAKPPQEPFDQLPVSEPLLSLRRRFLARSVVEGATDRGNQTGQEAISTGARWCNRACLLTVALGRYLGKQCVKNGRPIIGETNGETEGDE
jgi:hypothetical protein